MSDWFSNLLGNNALSRGLDSMGGWFSDAFNPKGNDSFPKNSKLFSVDSDVATSKLFNTKANYLDPSKMSVDPGYTPFDFMKEYSSYTPTNNGLNFDLNSKNLMDFTKYGTGIFNAYNQYSYADAFKKSKEREIALAEKAGKYAEEAAKLAYLKDSFKWYNSNGKALDPAALDPAGKKAYEAFLSRVA